jgi:hypothetical protein
MTDRIGSLSLGATNYVHDPINFCFVDHNNTFIATVPMIQLIVYLRDLYSEVLSCDRASSFFTAHLDYTQSFWPELHSAINDDAFKNSLFNSPLGCEYINSEIFKSGRVDFALPSPAVIRVNELFRNLFLADVFVGDSFVQLETVQVSQNPKSNATLCLGPIGTRHASSHLFLKFMFRSLHFLSKLIMDISGCMYMYLDSVNFNCMVLNILYVSCFP